MIERIGKGRFQLVQGESIRLQVKTEPGMPATFTSFDLGAFDNSLSSITVKANEDGVATAAFHATTGTLGEVNLVAASPVASERVNFRLFVGEASAP